MLDDRTIAFADFSGNRQYVTLGNLADNPRAHLFLIDYARRQRVKLWGRARAVDDDAGLIATLMPPGYAARAERAIQPDAVGEFTGQTRSLLSRIDHFLGLVDVVHWPAPRAKLAPYLRSMIAPEEMIREIGGARVTAIPTLATIARRISQTPFPDAIRREMVDILDSALFDTIRTVPCGRSAVLPGICSPFCITTLVPL